LAVKIVLPAKLTRPCFVAFLLACTTMIACLSSSDLFSSHLSLPSARVLADIRTLDVRRRLAIRLARCRWRWMVGCLAMVRRADGGIVATGDAAVGTVVWVHRPGTRMVAMLHAWWRLDVNEIWRGGRLRSRRRAVSGDAVLSNTSCHRRGAGDAMRTLARRRDVPRIRKRADVGWWKRR
jgi:hypothetical protein